MTIRNPPLRIAFSLSPSHSFSPSLSPSPKADWLNFRGPQGSGYAPGSLQRRLN